MYEVITCKSLESKKGNRFGILLVKDAVGNVGKVFLSSSLLDRFNFEKPAEVQVLPIVNPISLEFSVSVDW